MTRRVRDLAAVLRLLLAARRGMLAAGAALSALTVLAGVALLGLSGWFITATALAGLASATALAFDVFAPAAGIRFLALTRTGARYGERLATHDAALGISAALRERLFRAWARPDAARALRARPTKLLFRLTADTDALESLYLRLLVPLGAAGAALLAAGAALGLMDARLGLAVVSVLFGAGVLVPLAASRPAVRPAVRRARALERLRSEAADLVAGQADLAMAGRLPARRAALARADAAVARADHGLNRLDVGLSAAFGAAGALALAGSLLAVAVLVERGVIGAPVAALGVLIPLAALEPFAAVRRGMLELGRTLLAARRIAPRLTAPDDVPPLALPPAGDAVRLSGVDVVHPGRRGAAMRGLDLRVAEGERVAVIGPSGAGKSTLLALLCGEVAAATGRVCAVPATLLPQATQLFRDSLAGNLRLADPSADDTRLWQALDAAGLGADVRALPAGLDTLLGEAGLGLSGGQGRRLAIARLLLRDTPLWLLDEPTDGLDGATARAVLDTLDKLAAARGRTLVIATHIRREAERADRLIIMTNGSIVGEVRRGQEGFAPALDALRPD